MEISLKEAATLLGKSERQVRYLIKHGRLKATKVGGQWRVANADLTFTEGQREAVAERLDAARETVTAALEPATKATAAKERKRQYSVRDLEAFQAGAEVFHALQQSLGEEARGCALLYDALVLVARGCHSFHPQEKARRFHEARDGVASALVEILLKEGQRPETAGLAERMEQELIPKIGGLVATHEKRSRKTPSSRFGRGGSVRSQLGDA